MSGTISATLTHLIRNKGKNKKIQWRPSKAEVQESFVVHLPALIEIEEFLERRKNKYADLKETCQPVIIILGKSLIESEVLVSVNNLVYKAGNITRSVDITYKLFHVLSLKYPVECEHVWYFIQKYVYGMSTPWDKSFIVVEELLSTLEQM